jgi:hypothetical protein
MNVCARTSCEEEGYPAGGGFLELCLDAHEVGEGDGVLTLAVGRGEDLWDSGITGGWDPTDV